jgi:hypothetical protein
MIGFESTSDGIVGYEKLSLETDSLHTRFPYVNTLSYFIGAWKAYAVLKAHPRLVNSNFISVESCDEEWIDYYVVLE